MSIATEIQRLQTAKSDLKTAIEAKGVTIDESATIDTYASKVNEIQSDGNTFWDIFQNNGNLRNYHYAFAFNRFNDDNYNPKYTIKTEATSYSASYMFYSNSLITDTKVTIDVSDAAVCRYMFYYCTKLKTIRKIISGETSEFLNAFINCTSLENLTFEGVIKTNLALSQSKKLSDESVESIVNCLADLTGETTKTLTLHADVKAKIKADDEKEDTDETKHGWLSTITGKNWTLA